MNRINIGFDFDDCIVQTCSKILEVLGESTNTKYSIDTLKTYNIENSPEFKNIDSNLIKEAIHTVLLDNKPAPEKDALKILKWIYDSDLFKTFVITKRQKETVHVPIQVVGDFVEVICRTDSDNKSGYINEFNIEVFMDDRPSTILHTINETEANILVYDKPWNRYIKHDRVTRVYSWNEVKDYLILYIGGKLC